MSCWCYWFGDQTRLFTDVNQGWQSFSSKEQRVNILAFADKIVPIATTQLCLCGAKTTKDNTKMKWFTKLYLQTGNWLNLTCKHEFANSQCNSQCNITWHILFKVLPHFPLNKALWKGCLYLSLYSLKNFIYSEQVTF